MWKIPATQDLKSKDPKKKSILMEANVYTLRMGTTKLSDSSDDTMLLDFDEKVL